MAIFKVHIHLPYESTVRKVNDIELSLIFFALNLNSLLLYILWNSKTGKSGLPLFSVLVLEESCGWSGSMSMEKGPDLDRIIDLGLREGNCKGTRIGSFGFSDWKNGSLRSSFAGNLSDAGARHFTMNSLIWRSVTLQREAGLMPWNGIPQEVNKDDNAKKFWTYIIWIKHCLEEYS